jgi:hypothetical protein
MYELAMYSLADSIIRDRRMTSDKARLVAELKIVRGNDHGSDDPPSQPVWLLEWTTSGVTGKTVKLHSPHTADTPIGRDPGDWDRALAHASRLVA